MSRQRNLGPVGANDFIGRPLYRKLEAALMARIASGEWQAGALLPSEQALATEYGVAQGTARKAVDQLVACKLVVRQQGKGTFVATQDWQRAVSQFFRLIDDDGTHELPAARVIDQATGPALPIEAERLRLKARARVVRFTRLRYFDDTPVIVERMVLPAAMFPPLARRSDVTLPPFLYEHLARAFGVLIRGASENLRAVSADNHDAELLKIEPGSPLLEIDRVVVSVQGQPVEWRISRCNTTRHSYLNRIE
jgi:GntR family transcriptional regulator